MVLASRTVVLVELPGGAVRTVSPGDMVKSGPVTFRVMYAEWEDVQPLMA